jgi:hypothetical protein
MSDTDIRQLSGVPISRRDLFAAIALGALLAREGDAEVATLADVAVAHADQLIAALDAPEEQQS